MKKSNTKIYKEYENIFAEARASRWIGEYQHAEELLLKCYDYYKTTKNEEQLTDVIRELVDLYMDGEKYIDALNYVKELLEIFEKLGIKKDIANTLNDLGRICQNTSDFDVAIDYFTKSLKISREINYRLGISIALTNLATELRFKGKIEEALNHLLEAEKLCMKERFIENLVSVLIAIAIIYSDMGKIEFTEKYLIEAEINLGYIGKARLAAILYAELAKFYIRLENTEKSIELLRKGLKICQARGLESTKANLLLNFGIIKTGDREFDDASKYLHQALEVFRKFNNKRWIARVLTSLGDLLIKQNNFHKAAKYLKNSQEISRVENDILLSIRNYRFFGDMYKEQKKYYESYRNYTQCLMIYQQLLNNINTISLRESFKESFDNLTVVIYELNELLESGTLEPNISELTKTQEISKKVCEKSKEIHLNLQKEVLIYELKRKDLIINDLKSSNLETDTRKMLRRDIGYDIEDSGKNWIVKENEIKPLVKEKCYQDFSNKSIEIDIFGSKKDNGRTVFILGECKYWNKPISIQEIKCFIIKCNIIAKSLTTRLENEQNIKPNFHLVLISIEGFLNVKEICSLIDEFWELPKDRIVNRDLQLINREIFIKLLKKNNIKANIYKKI